METKNKGTRHRGLIWKIVVKCYVHVHWTTTDILNNNIQQFCPTSPEHTGTTAYSYSHTNCLQSTWATC